jgi:hypothetical protein
LAARIVEFFGYEPLDPVGQVLATAKECPFVQHTCIKPRHGACSLQQTSGAPIIICPNRLYDNSFEVLGDIAKQAFGPGVALTKSADIARLKMSAGLTGKEVAVFGKYWGSELSIPQPQTEEGSDTGGFFIDYVLARLEPTGAMAEFTAVEIQTIDTTNSYKEQSDAFFAGEPFVDSRGNNPGWSNAGLAFEASSTMHRS